MVCYQAALRSCSSAHLSNSCMVAVLDMETFWLHVISHTETSPFLGQNTCFLANCAIWRWSSSFLEVCQNQAFPLLGDTLLQNYCTTIPKRNGSLCSRGGGEEVPVFPGTFCPQAGEVFPTPHVYFKMCNRVYGIVWIANILAQINYILCAYRDAKRVHFVLSIK